MLATTVTETQTTQTHATPKSGRELKLLLAKHNLRPDIAVRKRDTGYFVIDYNEGEKRKSIRSSIFYAHRIQRALPGARIVEKYDTVAYWRDGLPVINAMLVLDLGGTHA
jgi:hypothetical protein